MKTSDWLVPVALVIGLFLGYALYGSEAPKPVLVATQTSPNQHQVTGVLKAVIGPAQDKVCLQFEDGTQWWVGWHRNLPHHLGHKVRITAQDNEAVNVELVEDQKPDCENHGR